MPTLQEQMGTIECGIILPRLVSCLNNKWQFIAECMYLEELTFLLW